MVYFITSSQLSSYFDFFFCIIFGSLCRSQEAPFHHAFPYNHIYPPAYLSYLFSCDAEPLARPYLLQRIRLSRYFILQHSDAPLPWLENRPLHPLRRACYLRSPRPLVHPLPPLRLSNPTRRRRRNGQRDCKLRISHERWLPECGRGSPGA